MKEDRAEGIVLKTFDYKENERIVTVFTENEGVITLIAKNIKNKIAITTPFCQAEFLFTKGKSDLFKFRDGTILNDHQYLRQKLSHIQAAAEMAKCVLKSQLPGKPAPVLYALLLAYLRQLSFFKEVSSLLISFQLKLLTHEGLLSWESLSLFPIQLAQSDWSILKELALSRSFKKIECICITSELNLKLKNSIISILNR